MKIPLTEDLGSLEFGSAYYALRYAYKSEKDRYNFDHKFNSEWINKVRNGHCHIDRIKTAYWFSHLIIALGDKGIL